MLGHLDPDFLQALDETCDRLRTVFKTANDRTLPISGTGSAGMEASFAVLKTVRRRSQVSSSAWRKSGSRCPSMGRPSASTASGYGLLGPGPMRTRSVSGTTRDSSEGTKSVASRTERDQR